MIKDKNTLSFKIEEEKIEMLCESFTKLGLNADEEFEKWVNRFIGYNSRSNSTSIVNANEENKIIYEKQKQKIDKWLEKKNSVSYYLIKAFFLSATASGKTVERYSAKKGEMRDKFCTFNEKFTKEVFDRNLKLMCTNSKTGYGRYFRIRRDRDNEANSVLTLFTNIGNYIDRYITSKKNEFLE